MLQLRFVKLKFERLHFFFAPSLFFPPLCRRAAELSFSNVKREKEREKERHSFLPMDADLLPILSYGGDAAAAAAASGTLLAIEKEEEEKR